MNGFRIMHRELLNRGVYLGPSGYEVGFVSEAHSLNDLDMAAKAMEEVLDMIYG